METVEERRARQEYVAAQFGHGDGEERKSKLEKMVATATLMLALTKGVVLDLNPF